MEKTESIWNGEVGEWKDITDMLPPKILEKVLKDSIVEGAAMVVASVDPKLGVITFKSVPLHG